MDHHNLQSGSEKKNMDIFITRSNNPIKNICNLKNYWLMYTCCSELNKRMTISDYTNT